MSTIVLIDDEEAICRALGNVLSYTGAEVQTFSDPRGAIAFIAEHPPAVVICDYRMPECDGLEVFAALDDEVPFILISGDLHVDVDVDATPGIKAVLRKPVKAKALIDAASAFL